MARQKQYIEVIWMKGTPFVLRSYSFWTSRGVTLRNKERWQKRARKAQPDEVNRRA